jgi:uncharacterized protein YcbK (DUF882 family)
MAEVLFSRSYSWAVWASLLSLLCVKSARAERAHTVREGQSLYTIARGYDVSVSSLAAANALTPESTLQVGSVLHVPAQGTVVLAPGQSLWTIARKHDCTVEALARANGIAPNTQLRPGTKLVLPGKRARPSEGKTKSASSEKSTQAPWSLKEPPVESSVKAGTVKLYRIATREQLKLTVTDPRGRVRPAALGRLAKFLKPRNSKKQRRPEPRLVALLAETSRHYGGKTIQIVSGYRVAGGYTSGESRHTRGAAVDIRIDGVPNRQLCDYLRHFKNVGVGFYPNSMFVHLDVRDKNAYWIDLSSPGRRPSYLDREQRDHFEGKNKDEGLVELGRSIEAVLGSEHEEPTERAPEAADE